MKPQREVGVAKKGMNKDLHVTSLDQNSYIHAVNANFQGQDGDSINLQNEESNILCSKFVAGFHVIGVQHDTTGERTYFFLTNPTTRESEIGFIADLENQISFTDTISECDCDIQSLLSSGLESIAQVATCTYTTLLKDHTCGTATEGAGCLGFNVNYPISSIIKQEKCGDVLYFTDDLNPRRRVEVARTAQYSKKTVFCDDATDAECDCGSKEVDVCLNCNKMNVLPNSEKLCIDILGSVVGGKTRHGQYMFFAGYCDSLGNLVNNYVAATNSCSINDANEEIYQQFDLDILTNLSIKLKVNNLDPSFDYYKVAVLQRNSVDGAENAYVVDILPTSTNELLYSGSQELQPIDARELVRELPDYLTAKTVTQANNQLFFSDLEARPDPNLQPVVNFMGQFAKWRTAISEEGLYSTTRGTGSFKGYMRDEVVPFGIRFVTDQGYKTPVYPLIPKEVTNSDKFFDSYHTTHGATLIQAIADAPSKISLNGILAPYGTSLITSPWVNDVYSIFKNGNNGCANEERIYKWQFYNTATNEGAIPGRSGVSKFTFTATGGAYTASTTTTLDQDLNGNITTSGSGSGFIATAVTDSGGNILSITITSGGTGYSVGDTITVDGTVLGGSSAQDVVITITKDTSCTPAASSTVFKLTERVCVEDRIGENSLLVGGGQPSVDLVFDVDEDEYDYTNFFAFLNDRQEDVQDAFDSATGPDAVAQKNLLQYFLKSSYNGLTGTGTLKDEIPCCDPSTLFDTTACSTPVNTDQIIDFISFDVVNGAKPEFKNIFVDCKDISRPPRPDIDNFVESDNNGDPKNLNEKDSIEFDGGGKLDEFEFWLGDAGDQDKKDFVFERTSTPFGKENCENTSTLPTNFDFDGNYPFSFHITPLFPDIDFDTELNPNTATNPAAIPLTTNSPYQQIFSLVYTSLLAGFGGGLAFDSRTARDGGDSNLFTPYGVNTVPHYWFRKGFAGSPVPPANPTFPIDILGGDAFGDRIKKDNCYKRGDLFEGGFFTRNQLITYNPALANAALSNIGPTIDQGFVGRNAIFFKIKLDKTKEQLVISVSNIAEGPKRKKKKDCLWYPAYVRVSLFKSCNQNPQPGQFAAHTIPHVNPADGTSTIWERCGGFDGTDPLIDQNSFLSRIGLDEAVGGSIDKGGINKIVINLKDNGSDFFEDVEEITVAVDTPLVSVTHKGTNPKSNFPGGGLLDKGLGDTDLPADHTRQYFYASGTWGTFSLKADYPEVDKVVLTNAADLRLNLEKTCVFTSRCPYEVYEDLVCNPVPFEQGKFSYWESTLDYPNNNFLYDSRTKDDGTNMAITEALIPPSIRTEFQNIFTTGAPAAGEPYVLTSSADFSCKPIRHFKFPDFNISPAFDQDALPFTKNNIFPIGIHIDNEVVGAFLNVAVANNYITQEFRDSITHYEIFRGDTKFDRSVMAKGLLYDMYQYPEFEFSVEDSNTNNLSWFSNFPYNDLSDNKLLYKNEDRSEFIPHPFKTANQGAPTKSNYKYTFHSPDTHFNKPILPFEMYVESHFIGQSRGSFVAVKNHPLFTVLTPNAHDLARRLATTEVALDIAINTTNFLIQANQALSGFPSLGFFGAITAFALFTASTAINTRPQFVRLKTSWEEIFYNRGERHNFAYYYSSIGYYNQFYRNSTNNDGVYDLSGNKLRGLKERIYVKDGRYRFDEAFDSSPTVINNTFRESSVYLSLGTEVTSTQAADTDFNYSFNLTPPTAIRDRDSSRYVASDNTCVNVGDRTPESTRDISSPYVSLKQFIPNQFGNINDIKYIYTAYCGKLTEDNSCDIVYGGDTFINRFYLKRKFPFFLAPMVDGPNALADMLPFNYLDVRNVGYPKYYLNYRMSERDDVYAFGNVPNMQSDYEFDCNSSNQKYVIPPSKFYLYYYGIPGFMVESHTNIDFRYGEDDRAKGYYPAQSDFYNWTQEMNVPIREDNYFFYWNVYSTDNDRVGYRYLPDNYDPAEFNCRFDHYDRTIYSLPDSNEQDLLDNYRVFLANNFYDFGSKYGPLKALHSIESAKVLGLFENGVVVFNAYSTLQGTTDDYLVGNAGIFANRPQEYFKSELGYGGTQHRAFATCQYGHFWVDAKRGRVYSVQPGGAGMQEISQSGMVNWFRENLPFRIKKQFPNISDNMIDNAFEGLGISMVWDDRYSRLFITKLDAKVKSGITLHQGDEGTMPLNSVAIGRRYTDDKEDLDFYYLPPTGGKPFIVHPQTHPEIFDDASWTISYSPLTKSWVSFHSFLPNYYVAHNNYFSSGLNFGSSSGIWNHLLGSNQTFQVYYGTLYPFIIETAVKQNFSTRMYEDFSYRLDVRRYSNEYDYHYFPENFDTVVFYNDREATGLLSLITQEQNNQQQLIELPKFTGTGVDVLATKSDYTWSVNFFFDNLRENHTLPIWKNAANNVDKSLNATAFNYLPSFKNHIRRQYLIARLSQNNESRLKFIFEHFISDSLLYDAY